MTRCWRTRNSTRRMSSSVEPQAAADARPPARRPSRCAGCRTACPRRAAACRRPARPGGSPPDRLARDRVRSPRLAARERVQPRHRVERVLVHGVHVIDVVLHAPGRRLPLGHHRAEQPEILHPLQPRRVRAVARVAAELDEAPAGLDVLAQQLGPRRRQLAQQLPRPQRERNIQP